MKISQVIYLIKWFLGAKFFGKKKPLQSVIFVSDKCNLRCKHCSVYNNEPITKSFEQLKEEMRYCYALGSRFIDFEGGETTLWQDKDKDINSLIECAKQMGFYSCTITTNAQKDFENSKADSIWVSLDGVGEVHEKVRGVGTFKRLEKNIQNSHYMNVSVNMAINTLNAEDVENVIEYVRKSPYIKSISLNFHTPFPKTEYLTIDKNKKIEILKKIISYKQKNYPIMNSMAGLKTMLRFYEGKISAEKFASCCWVTNFVFTDGTKLPQCAGKEYDACKECGFGMGSEMLSLFSFSPSTILAGLKLRL